MQAFAFSDAPLEPGRYRDEMGDPASGGYATFEGWVRDHNDGRRVKRLEYEAFESLGLREGERIVLEAVHRFGVHEAACVHRLGSLAIGDLAVWVGVSAAHRAEAFAACRYIIDEVKHRVPIWKKEHYTDGDSGWVNCERCAAAAHEGADIDASDGAPTHHPEHVHDRDDDGDHAHAHRHDRGRQPEPRAAFMADYSRQVALPEVGLQGQEKLRRASVLVVGAGGLGVPVLQYLAAAGVGRIGIVDGDRVEASNLHRQPLYEAADVGQPKATTAAARLARLNPALKCQALDLDASASNIDELVGQYAVVVECTDNFRAKFLVNDAVVRAGRPAVFASVYQYEGQVQTYRPEPDWPCVRCVWPDAPRDGLVGNCAEAGVLGPVPATLGALQAMEVLKLILGLPSGPPGLLVVDLLHLGTKTVIARRDPACAHGESSDAYAAADAPLEVEFLTLAAAREAGYELVDIREAWERRFDPPGPQIELHLPLSELLDGRAEFPAAGRHLIVCEHGVRSLALAEHLRSRGRGAVYSMRGGLAALRA